MQTNSPEMLRSRVVAVRATDYSFDKTSHSAGANIGSKAGPELGHFGASDQELDPIEKPSKGGYSQSH